MARATYTDRFERFLEKPLVVFTGFWLIALALYLPAAKAGMVGDLPYYVDTYRHSTFWEFINIKDATALYHTAALNLYIILKLFGTDPWGWYIVYVTLHAINGLLIFLFFSRLLQRSGVQNAKMLSLAASCLFIVCPHASEPVVWEPCAHYLMTICITFLVLICVQKFQETQKIWYAVVSALLFLYTSFSHEFFYLIPWFTLLLIFYYRIELGYDKVVFRKSLAYLFAPLLLLFFLHLVLLHIFKHTYISHFGKLDKMPLAAYLSKPLKYFFHTIFLGRFFSHEFRTAVYSLCESTLAMMIFYLSFGCFWGYVLFRTRQVSGKLKTLAFTTAAMMMIFLFLSPVYFPDTMLVCYDRYTYLSLAFALLTVVLIINLIPWAPGRAILLAGYLFVNIFYTIRVNMSWKQSAYTVNRLLNEFPEPGSKTILLLNLPDDLNGTPMIAAEDDGRFKMMKNTLTAHPLNNKVHDVIAYKLSTINDGAHVMVVNDSTVDVMLNQPGGWWIRGMLGARDYENEDYKVHIIDPGRAYELNLKQPAAQFILLYETNSHWSVVDWNKKNVDQY